VTAVAPERRRTVVWFRRDLRLADNPALARAASLGDVLPLFVLDPALLGPAGEPRTAFLFGCLRALADSTGGRLVVRSGRPDEVLPAIAGEVDATEVVAADDFGPYGRTRDEAVERRLDRAGIGFERIGSPYAVEPGAVTKGDGSPYSVFTPYFRRWLAHGWGPPAPRSRRIRWIDGVEGEELPAPPATGARLPAPGEAAAHNALRSFRERVDDYARDRNRPDLDGTSRLSPYLRFGCLHPRQALDGLGSGEGPDAFRREIGWRDFCADLLFQRPETARAPSNPKLAGLEADHGPDADGAFDAWRQGRTGFPMVDAGMRQLLADGWVHNRVRMLVASFLVKDLHLPWEQGARWFMERLVDGDLPSNSQNWQWVAGTGVDPSPFVRVFNPTTQGKRFDPDGEYIRRYVTELRPVDGPAVHDPHGSLGPLEFAALGYPEPIVDHAAERAEALARYTAATGR
jgi:deoxyribodipyrimidine photo-lyase